MEFMYVQFHLQISQANNFHNIRVNSKYAVFACEAGCWLNWKRAKHGSSHTHTHKNTHKDTALRSCNHFFQPSAVQSSALPHSKASRSTAESVARLWVVEAERW